MPTNSPSAVVKLRVTLIMKRRKQPEVAPPVEREGGETGQLTQWEYAFLAFANDGAVGNRVNMILNGEVVMRKDMSEERGPNPGAFLFAYIQELGSQGWEIVKADSNRFIFKRRKP